MQTYEHYSVKAHNTFMMDVSCDRFVCVEHPDEVRQLAEQGVFQSEHFILGGGSNVLFTQDYSGTIVHPVFKGMEVIEETADNVLLRVAAGEEWEQLQQYCLQHQLYGIENLIGIPGLVGSAPVQNIGAYGVEVKDTIASVEGLRTDTLQPFALSNAQCHFGYRDSIFKRELKHKCFITHVIFRLSKREHYTLTYKALSQELERCNLQPSLQNITDCILRVRNSKLPDISKIGCAGSFFQNPIVPQVQYEQMLRTTPDLVSYPMDNGFMKLAAGQLIEKAGWKGRRIGDAGVYDKQALVLVNYGNATPQEIASVCQQVIEDVKKHFGVTLAPEVNML